LQEHSLSVVRLPAAQTTVLLFGIMSATVAQICLHYNRCATKVHQYTVQICLLFLSSPLFDGMHMRSTNFSKMAPLMFYTYQIVALLDTPLIFCTLRIATTSVALIMVFYLMDRDDICSSNDGFIPYGSRRHL
jgi:hypothetical protein